MATTSSEAIDRDTHSKSGSDIESKLDKISEKCGSEVAHVQVSQPPAYHFPEGGRKAWFVVLGCWCTSFTSYGYVNSFGVYETYYLQTYLSGYSPSTVAWIGSIQTFSLLSATIVSGPVTDRCGAMILIWPFSLLLVVSMMLTSLCREYYQFIICQGILSGICSGMVFNSAMTVVGHYFFKKRAMAMAFASTGSPTGGIIYPIIMTNMLHTSRLGFPWGQRVCGFLSLFLLSIAAITIRPTQLRRSGKFMLLGAFKKPAYSLQVAGLFLVILGLWTPYFYLATYGLAHGMSPTLATYLFALINGGSLVGRVVSGSVAQYVGQFNLVTLGCYSSAVLLFSWLAIESTVGIIVLALLYGGSSGIVVALMPATLAHTADHPSNIGTYIGQAVFVVAIAAIGGTPITGTLIHSDTGYVNAIAFSASVIMAGAIVYTFARVAYDKKQLLA